MIRILVTDDHEMIRNGISSLIRTENDIHVVTASFPLVAMATT